MDPAHRSWIWNGRSKNRLYLDESREAFAHFQRTTTDNKNLYTRQSRRQKRISSNRDGDNRKLFNETPKNKRNKSDDKKIKEVLDAISYSVEHQQTVPASIQKNANGDSLFYIFQQANGETTLFGFSKSSIIQNMDRPLIK